jgi:TRAP-type C4-dicarboxylate transport system substrate-binding protein
VLTAMQTGLIDTVINSPIGAIALQWHTRVKYVVDLPLVYYSAMMVIDKKAFDKINPEDAVIVRRIMGDVFKEINAQNRKDNIAAREALKAQGIEFIQLTDAALKDWHNIAEKAMLQIETRDDYSKEVYATLKQRLAQFVAKP